MTQSLRHPIHVNTILCKAGVTMYSYIEHTEQASSFSFSSVRKLTEDLSRRLESLVVAQIGVATSAPVGTTIRPLYTRIQPTGQTLFP